jgi:hypothetical protein
MRAIVLDRPGSFQVAEGPDPAGHGIKWHIRP